ncbi:hypothetical protein R3P38DRAFT_2546049, partial [Favolaschia claudopus]
MAGLGEPVKGGPKIWTAIRNKWKDLHKLHEHFVQIKQKTFVGASGWNYSDELGFNVDDDNREAWGNFVKAHPQFRPFANRGWEHFKTMDEIVPSRARGL